MFTLNVLKKWAAWVFRGPRYQYLKKNRNRTKISRGQYWEREKPCMKQEHTDSFATELLLPDNLEFFDTVRQLLHIASSLAVTSLSWVTIHQNAMYNLHYRQQDISLSEFYFVIWDNWGWFEGLWSNSWWCAFPQHAIQPISKGWRNQTKPQKLQLIKESVNIH